MHVPEDCRHAILAAYPHLSGSVFTVAGKGWHSLAVEADGLIFKFPEGDEAESALLREAKLLAAVRPLVTVAVPDMIIHPGPPMFSMHRKLPGRTLEPSDYPSLDDAARERLADDLALFFAELHAIEPSVMRAAGAEPVGWWDTRDDTLAPAWSVLPPQLRPEAEAAIRDYHVLGPDPLGEVYGFFDAHGWNMAFDRDAMRLRGIFDFADSGSARRIASSCRCRSSTPISPGAPCAPTRPRPARRSTRAGCSCSRPPCGFPNSPAPSRRARTCR
jgi:hypothetical protein